MAAGEETLEILIRTRGGRVAAAEIQGVSAATGRLAASTNAQATASNRAAAASARTSGAWAAMGAAATRVSGAMGALGVATGAFIGLKFNATMESNTVAFGNFLGSTEAAEKHLDHLYKVASTTPFEFPDLVSGSRRLLAFGQSAEESNKWLSIIGDTVAGIGGSTPEINRMVAAIGQIQAKGKASTEEMLQLAELGIPAFEALAKGTGRTTAQVFDDLADGAISSEEALGALQKHLADAFGGSSVKQAATFSGQLSTLKDNATAALGALTEPLFDLLRTRVFPALNEGVGKFADFLRGGGLQRVAGKVLPALASAFEAVKGVVMDVWNALAPAMPLFQNVLGPLLLGFAGGALAAIAIAFKAVIFVVGIVARALGWLGDKLEPLRGLFGALGAVVGAVFGGPILGAIRIFGKLGAALRLGGKLISLLGGVFGRVFGVIGSVASRVVGSVTARFSGLVRFFGRMPERIRSIGSRMWTGIREGFRSVINWIIGAWNGINFSIGGGSIRILGKEIDVPRVGLSTPDIPLLATGGTIVERGAAIVGDRGPELLELPRGAQVTPLGPSDGAGGVREVVRLVTVEGRVLAEAVFGAAEQARARA